MTKAGPGGSGRLHQSMGRFETGAMTSVQNLTALADPSGRWIERVQARRPGQAFVLSIWEMSAKTECTSPLTV